ncbi:MAG: hypothetical protein K5888_00855, partial [Lachnospiraceae bacterium]|nr:hypothetical protein [Lachnospiraceae bacterium]
MNEKQSKLNKYTAYISLGILTVTMLPLIYCSFFDRATGDDLGYSAAVHRIMLRHGSLREIISSMADLIVHFRKYYQGTWSSLILFQLQPGIWGEKVYMITPWIAVACIMGGSFVFSDYLLRKKLGLDRYSFLTVYSLIMILSIQFLPTVRGGLFWWTSVSHYIIPYGIALCCFTWSMKWLDTGKIRYLVLQTIGMIHLGGGGYPEVVLAAAWYFFLALAVILKIYESDETKRLRYLAIPFICEMAGFAVSATAPGNSKRGGEGFGFSVGRVISTVFTSFKDTFKSIFDNFISVRPTAFVLLILILILISAEISHRISLK